MAIRVYIRKRSDREHLLLYYKDPHTGKERHRSAGTSIKKEAERAAGKWEQELVEWHGTDGAGWQVFRQRFGDEHLSLKAANTRASYTTALNCFQERVKVTSLNQITASTISSFTGTLAKEKRPHSTIANYLTHLRAALRWAESVGMMRKAPAVKIPSVVDKKHMRGRPLTPRELVRLLRACDKLHDDAAKEWRRLIELLWFSGLRLGEALVLSWDKPPLTVHLRAKPYPLIVIDSEGQKSRADTAVPMPPDLVAWLNRTPEAQRTGYVIDVRNSAGRRYNADKLSDEVSAIGRAAKVVVEDGEDPQYATAHDIRRSFGSRWAMKVRPMTLQKMMRHADLSTTLKFYVGLSVEDVGAELWNREQPK